MASHPGSPTPLAALQVPPCLAPVSLLYHTRYLTPYLLVAALQVRRCPWPAWTAFTHPHPGSPTRTHLSALQGPRGMTNMDDEDNQTASSFATLPAAGTVTGASTGAFTEGLGIAQVRLPGHGPPAHFQARSPPAVGLGLAQAEETRRLQWEVASLTQQLADAGAFVSHLADRLQRADAAPAVRGPPPAAAAAFASASASASASSELALLSPVRGVWPGTPLPSADASTSTAILAHEKAKAELALKAKEMEVERRVIEARALQSELTRAYESLTDTEASTVALLKRHDDAAAARDAYEARATAAEAAAATSDAQLARLSGHLDDLLTSQARVEGRNAELEARAAAEAAAQGALVAQVRDGGRHASLDHPYSTHLTRSFAPGGAGA